MSPRAATTAVRGLLLSMVGTLGGLVGAIVGAAVGLRIGGWPASQVKPPVDLAGVLLGFGLQLIVVAANGIVGAVIGAIAGTILGTVVGLYAGRSIPSGAESQATLEGGTRPDGSPPASPELHPGSEPEANLLGVCEEPGSADVREAASAAEAIGTAHDSSGSGDIDQAREARRGGGGAPSGRPVT